MSEMRYDGLLELIGDKKFGFIRDWQPDLPKGKTDPFVPPSLIKKFGLRDGIHMVGDLRRGKKGAMQVQSIDEILGMPPEIWTKIRNFDDGNTIYPDEKFNLVTAPSDLSMRVIDLVAPMGKGQRALIVAPPRTGKTIMLKGIAAGLSQNHPDTKIVALLVDERPEEITDFKRTVDATIFASSNDREDDNHVRVSTMALEHARRLVELRQDVVLLLDSLTRLGRTFNLYQSGSGRTMSGGLDSKALKIPRKIFGSARNIEDGGSLTIIGTALIETGSRMDEVIFEEFKGTGNSEIVLDRIIADKRIYPAVNIRKSRTRNEDRLIGEYIDQHQRLFAALNSRSPVEGIQALTRHIQQTASNEELLNSLVKAD